LEHLLEPKIEKLSPAPHVAWRVDGTVLIVGMDEHTIDLAERQDDDVVIIDICDCPGKGLMEGVCGAYVLSVEIPPKRYRTEAWVEEEVNVLVPEPLDVASVTLRLWTYEKEED
jgi:hypothetical protein